MSEVASGDGSVLPAGIKAGEIEVSHVSKDYGDARFRTEVVRDVVIVLTGDAPPAELFAQLSELPGVSEFAGQDERRVTLRFAGNAVWPAHPRRDSGARTIFRRTRGEFEVSAREAGARRAGQHWAQTHRHVVHV